LSNLSVIAALLITACHCLAILMISNSTPIYSATILSKCSSNPKTALLPSIAISLLYFLITSLINLLVFSLFHILTTLVYFLVALYLLIALFAVLSFNYSFVYYILK